MTARGEPCLHYDVSFEESDVPEARLEATVGAGANAIRQKARVMKFSGAEGVEGLFITKDMFEQAVLVLGWNQGPARFQGFVQCLKGAAWKTWTRQVANLNNNQRTNARFEIEYERLVLVYAQSTRAKDIMIEYLTHGREIGKKFGVDNRAHVDRVQALCDYTNRLPGTVPDLNEVQIRAIIIASFPSSWKTAFERANLDENNTTTEQVIEYMNKMKNDNERTFKKNKRDRNQSRDDVDDNNNKKPRANRNRGGGRGGRQNNRQGGRDSRNNNNNNNSNRGCSFPRCKQMGYQNHNWHNCWWNPDGPNYRPMTSSGRPMNQNSGGGGRGYGNNNNNNNRNNNRGGRGQGPTNQNTGGNRQDQHFNERRGGRSNGSNEEGQHDQHHFDRIDTTRNTQRNDQRRIRFSRTDGDEE